MIDFTVQHITDPQFKMKGGIPKQYGNAYNGKYVWVSPPPNFDQDYRGYYDPKTGEDWRWHACITDNFGVLQPVVDFFEHGSDDEQSDETIAWFLEGRTIGSKVEHVTGLRLVVAASGRVFLVDDFFNVYTSDCEFEDSDLFAELILVKAGPWGHVKDKLDLKDLSNSKMSFLVY